MDEYQMKQREAENELYKQLTEAAGVSGFEDDIRKVMEQHLQPLAELSNDHLGSLVARKAGSAEEPRIMVAAHMDEIGFIVTQITDEGFLRFQTVGGWWEQVMLAQRVRVKTRNGDVLGVTGSKPPHILPSEERKKPVDKKNMFIDIGAMSADEAREMGVRPGDPVVPETPFTVLSNTDMLLAKAWDNRAGCAALIQLFQSLQKTDHPNTVYGVGTVQEEVGLRGAQTSAAAVAPDIAFAVDVGIPGDTPGVSKTEALTSLGKGPSIVLIDASMIGHRALRDFVVDTAEAENIPYQFDAMPGGGTDAGKLHLWDRGVPSLVIGIPTRYIHSHAAILHRDDLNNTVRLLQAVIQRLDAETVDKIRRG